jgi:hypothetical protein
MSQEQNQEEALIHRLVNDLVNPDKVESRCSRLISREPALLELSKRRDDTFPDLAPILWHSHGVIATLVQVFKDASGQGNRRNLSPPVAPKAQGALVKSSL